MSQRIAVGDESLVEDAGKIGAAASNLKDKIVAGAKDRLESSREYVSENPMKSILIAVGVGAVIGYLIGRRTS